MLVVSAERGGLYANVNRMVHFEEPDTELKRRHEACEILLRRMREEVTRPGRTLADAFKVCQRFYAEAGFPDEWRLHHRGGLTVYTSRESIATPPAYAARDTGGSGFRLAPLYYRGQSGGDVHPHQRRVRTDYRPFHRWWVRECYAYGLLRDRGHEAAVHL